MPNDLTTKRTLLDAREDLRLESRRKLASSGFTASTWTLSGVVLVACGGAGEITDALCPNFDAAVLVSCGGGSPPSGERHYVQSSPVQGARLYFDMNNDKVINDDDIATQNGQYPEGFVTDANGEIAPIPLHLYGKSFVAYLDGAINADTGESFPAGTEYYSITHPSDEDDMPASDEGDQDNLLLPFHNLASPITNWIARQAELEGRVLTSRQVFEDVNNVIANFLGRENYSMLTNDEQIAFNLLYAAILNPANYEGNPAIEALSAYLATNPSLTDVRSNAQTLIATLTDADVTTLIVLHVDDDTTSANMIDLPDVTIGTNAEAGAYIATVYAVSAGAVSYRMVDENDVEVSGGNFVVDSRTGVISVADGADLTASNTAIPVYVQVTSGGESETVKIDVTVQSVATLTAPTTSGTMEIAENTLGSDADPVVTGIDAGSSAVKANFIISDAADSPPGYAAMFDIVQDGTTWNLVLRDTESLDYEAIRGGEIKLNVQVDTATHAPSDVLEFTITVTDDPMDITFSGDFGGEVIEDATDEDNLEGSVSGTITIANQPQNEDVTVSTQGTYGTLTLNEAGDGWTYTLGVDANDAPLADEFLTKIQSLRTDEFLVDTATISVGTASKDIYVIIHGENEVVGFVDAPRVAMDIEIGDTTALDGSFALGNVLSDFGVNLDGRLDDAATTVAFADSVSADLRTLFTLTERGDGVGTLTFTGDNAAALARGVSTIELAMIASTPQSTTEEIPPFMVQVNVANDVDNGDASYEITENQAGTELSVALVDGLDANDDPDGVHADSVTMYQWFTIGGASDSTTKTNIGTPTTSDTLDISSHTLPIGATYGVTITYTDNHDFANGETTEFDVLYFSVYFYNHPQDAIMVNENDADGVAPTGLPTVQAMGGAAIDSYRITSGNTGGKFAISNEGVITLASGETLDYDTDPTSYTLTILAEDANTSANSATVTINLTDINDNDPAFAQPTYTQAIDETLAPGASVISVPATDADGTDANSNVRYSIISGNIGNVFEINESTGEITVAAGADFNYDVTADDLTPTRIYTLMIGASDGLNARGAADQTFTADDTAVVTININDVNDEDPTLTYTGTSTINNGVQGGTGGTETGITLIVTDDDADATNSHSYAVTGTYASSFEVKSGKLFLKEGQSVDVGEFTTDITLTITITDDQPGDNDPTDAEDVTITVMVEAPMSNSPPYTPDDLGLTPMPDADPQAG